MSSLGEVQGLCGLNSLSASNLPQIKGVRRKKLKQPLRKRRKEKHIPITHRGGQNIVRFFCYQTDTNCLILVLTSAVIFLIRYIPFSQSHAIVWVHSVSEVRPRTLTGCPCSDWGIQESTVLLGRVGCVELCRCGQMCWKKMQTSLEGPSLSSLLCILLIPRSTGSADPQWPQACRLLLDVQSMGLPRGLSFYKSVPFVCEDDRLYCQW